jgi:hypothetical protein
MKSCKLTLLTLALCASTATMAAVESAPAPAAPADIFEVKTLEEVVVTGQLETLSGLTKAIIEAESRFYERFNELNNAPGMDIRCRSEAPTGKRLKVRNCFAVAADEATREDALRFMGITTGTASIQSPYEIQAAMRPELKKRTLEMLKKDPELLRALLEHARLTKMYTELRAKKFAASRVVWD